MTSTGKSRPGISMTGQPPKYSENKFVSIVAEVTITFKWGHRWIFLLRTPSKTSVVIVRLWASSTITAAQFWNGSSFDTLDCKINLVKIYSKYMHIFKITLLEWVDLEGQFPSCIGCDYSSEVDFHLPHDNRPISSTLLILYLPQIQMQLFAPK